MPAVVVARHPGRGHRREPARGGEHGHAADDPRRASRRAVGSRNPCAAASAAPRSEARRAGRAAAPAAPVRRPSRGSASRWSARRHRRASPARGRGAPRPASRGPTSSAPPAAVATRCHAPPLTRPCSANADTSMPSTYSVTPRPLYQMARCFGCGEEAPHQQRPAPAAARPPRRRAPARPSRTSSAITAACGTAITQQATTRGAWRAEHHRQRADAHAAVARHRLEVVERHDPVRAALIERGQASAKRRLGQPPDMTAAPVTHASPS